MQQVRGATAPISNTGIRVIAVVFFALLTALAAQIRVHLPFTPVPVTLQVLAVLLSGLALGTRLGVSSQILYLAMGCSGLPVFAGFSSGVAEFAGPTGGYMVGFILGAYAAGFVFERLGRKSHVACFVAGIAGIIGIYTPGFAWLAAWTGSLKSAWQLGIVPFIGVDLLKAIIASGMALGVDAGRGMIDTLRRAGC